MCSSSASGGHARQGVVRGARQHDPDAHQRVGDGNEPEPAEVLARHDADVAGPPAFARAARRSSGRRRRYCRGRARPRAGRACARGARRGRRRRRRPRPARRSGTSAASRNATVAPSPSKTTSSTRWPSRTSAPEAAACRSKSSSNSARGTCQVCGVRTSGATEKSAKRSKVPSPVPKVAPHLAGNPRRAHEIRRADLFQDLVHRREQRFAHVKARESVALQEDHAPARAGQAARRRGAGGPTADHGDIELMRTRRRHGRDSSRPAQPPAISSPGGRSGGARRSDTPARPRPAAPPSSSAWAHGVLVDPGAVHVCYCHNPFRYAWTEREATLRARHPVVRPVLRRAAEPLAPVGLDRRPARGPLRRQLAPHRGPGQALLRARVDRPLPARGDRPLPAGERRGRALHGAGGADGPQADRRGRARLRRARAAAARGGRRARAAASQADRRARRSASPAA